jgi:HEAT repeat protein
VYFVMEYLEGQSLEALMAKILPLPMPLLFHIYAQVIKALAAAHGKQIVHRDLKPANIVIVKREVEPFFVKLLDFGIAKLRGEGATHGLTSAGEIMGTPHYMSPEQVMGKLEIDARSDIFSIGIMLYRSATGIPPFSGDNFRDIASQVLYHTPPPPSQVTPGLPPSFDALVMKAIQKEPQDRYAAITDMGSDLERIRAELGIEKDAYLAYAETKATPAPRPPAPAPARIEAPAKTALAKVLAALAAALLAAGIASFVLLRKGSDTVAASRAAQASPDAAPRPAESIRSKLDSGDLAGARELAAQGLRDALGSGNSQQKSAALAALEQVPTPETAPFLYGLLTGTPEIRIRAARALRQLELPDAAPKLWSALETSGDKVKVELAACLLSLGDKSAIAIVKRALEEPGNKLVAAVALATTGDKALGALARPILEEIFGSTPEGRETWRWAAEGLLAIGDVGAKQALAAELFQRDASRAVAAAALLFAAGDEGARGYLERALADPEYTRRGEAALALARGHSTAGLRWVAQGLKSGDADERKMAIAVAALLWKDGGDEHRTELATLASGDPDPGVRLVTDAALLRLDEGPARDPR